MVRRDILAGAILLLGQLAPGDAEPEQRGQFTLNDGDRVVFLGNSFFERALHHGHLETALAARWPKRMVTFRNLGWDGDTVYGHSRTGGRRRAVFGEPEEGFRRMSAQVRSLDPTVVFVAYGANESFEGDGGPDHFRKGLERLLGEIAVEGRRFVLLSPTPVERGFGTDLPFTRSGPTDASDYVTRRNATLGKYRDVIASVAREGGHDFVDLFGALRKGAAGYSENGLHPGGEGYRKIAAIIARQLALPKPGIDLKSMHAEILRAAIVKKNTLYFHRWRPRNDAFVYGERKDEQRIAQTEPEQFEPLVAAQEKVIRKLLGGAK